MTEWLKLMLEEIRRKQSEREDAVRERQRRAPAPTAAAVRPPVPPGGTEQVGS